MWHVNINERTDIAVTCIHVYAMFAVAKRRLEI